MERIAEDAAKRRRARPLSTVVILVGLVGTGILLPSDGPAEIFSAAAYGVGLALAVAILIEASSGIRTLIRVDLLLFAALYGLTLLEFLFRQPAVDSLIGSATAMNGTYAVLVAFGG